MSQASTFSTIIFAVIALRCSSTCMTDGSCAAEDHSLNMLQMKAKAKNQDVLDGEPIDHVKGVSKDKTPWLHSDEYYVNKTALIEGYERLDGDCPWNNLVVYEKTGLFDCASKCDEDCACLGYSWALGKDFHFPGRCVTKSKICTKNQVWKNEWTFYVKLPSKLCTAAKCAAWGDPHYTSTFYGGTPDSYSYGVFDIALAENNSVPYFRLQGFQGPLGWGAGFAGFAMEGGGNRMTIIGKEIRYNGNLLTPGETPSWMTISDDNTTVRCASATFGVDFKSVYKTTTMDIGPGYYHNMNIAIDDQLVVYKGICGSDEKPKPVPQNKIIFQGAALENLCKMIPGDNPSCFEEVAPKSAEYMCSQKSVSYSDAQAKCKPLVEDEGFYKACLFDYCASNGADDMVAGALESKEEETKFGVNTTTGAPPATTTTAMPSLIGCFKDSWDRDLPEKKSDFSDPEKCNVLCEGYKYFAIQAAVECFCGNDYGKHGAADDCECDKADWKGKGFRNCVYGTPK